MEQVNGKSPIWVEVKNVSQFGFIKKLIEEDTDGFSTIELEVIKHEGVIVKINHTTKYRVKAEKTFDTKI